MSNEKTLEDVENVFDEFLMTCHKVFEDKSTDELKKLLYQYKVQSSIFALAMSTVLENHIYFKNLYKKHE